MIIVKGNYISHKKTGPVFEVGFLVYLVRACIGNPSRELSGCAPQVQDVLRAQRLVAPVLHLQDHRPALQRTHPVPLPQRDVQRHDRTARRQLHRLRAAALQLIVVLLHQTTPKAHHRLRRTPVTVDRHLRPRLDRVQHPLRTVSGTVPQVLVHPQARRALRLFRQAVQQRLRDSHSAFVFMVSRYASCRW